MLFKVIIDYLRCPILNNDTCVCGFHIGDHFIYLPCLLTFMGSAYCKEVS